MNKEDKVRQAYQGLPYTPTDKEWIDLLEDNNRLRLALSEAVKQVEYWQGEYETANTNHRKDLIKFDEATSQIQQLHAQLDYTRALNSNLDNRG